MKRTGNRFYFHYNKPASNAAGKPQITLHFAKQCLVVDGLICGVPTESRINAKKNPHFMMTGLAETVEIKNGIGLIS